MFLYKLILKMKRGNVGSEVKNQAIRRMEWWCRLTLGLG
jgi:hypothetical protein